jgi:hypothetical protein
MPILTRPCAKIAKIAYAEVRGGATEPSERLKFLSKTGFIAFQSSSRSGLACIALLD